MKQSQSYTIKEVSEFSGLPESTLRYYEIIGIISPIGRDPSSKHRSYSESDLNIVTAIACLNATGMSLEDMKTYLKNAGSGKRSAPEQIDLLATQKNRLADEMRQLKFRRQYVDLKIAYWEAIGSGNKKQAETIAQKAKKLAKDLKSSIK